jgi:hypothetical protein
LSSIRTNVYNYEFHNGYPATLLSYHNVIELNLKREYQD